MPDMCMASAARSPETDQGRGESVLCWSIGLCSNLRARTAVGAKARTTTRAGAGQPGKVGCFAGTFINDAIERPRTLSGAVENDLRNRG